MPPTPSSPVSAPKLARLLLGSAGFPSRENGVRRSASCNLLTGLLIAGGLAASPFASSSHAVILTRDDGVAYDYFGSSASLFGNRALIGANGTDYPNFRSGSAHYYRNLDTATGTVTTRVDLLFENGAANDYLGSATALGGNFALVGAPASNSTQGAVHLFTNLDNLFYSWTFQTATLKASDGGANDRFGRSIALLGNTALVGADGKSTVYLFRNVDSATGSSVHENAKLQAAQHDTSSDFGYSVSVSGNSALVGAPNAVSATSGNNRAGSAYLFRDVHTAENTVNQTVELTTNVTLSANADFGTSVSLSGNMGLVGASGDTVNGATNAGAAYLYRGLDTATGTKTNSVRLIASDYEFFDDFGKAVALSGETALIGGARSAYLFTGLETATGQISESVRIFSNLSLVDGNRTFASGIAVEGDKFVITEYSASSALDDPGRAYTGTLSSFATVDQGNSTHRIDDLSFESNTRWIIGHTTDNNHVTLCAGSIATINAGDFDNDVRIGESASSDNNTLTIKGTLSANTVKVSYGGTGNRLEVASGGTVSVDTLSIGHATWASGTADIAGTVHSNLVFVGEEGANNALNIASGGFLHASTLYLGLYESASGTANVNGGLQSDSIFVGYLGSGNTFKVGGTGHVGAEAINLGSDAYFEIAEGGEVDVIDTFSMGWAASSGTASIAGTLSSDILYVGETGGNSTLKIGSTGTVNTTSAYIGFYEEASGDVEVAGTLNADYLHVGYIGSNNRLKVQETGNVYSTDITVRSGLLDIDGFVATDSLVLEGPESAVKIGESGIAFVYGSFDFSQFDRVDLKGHLHMAEGHLDVAEGSALTISSGYLELASLELHAENPGADLTLNIGAASGQAAGNVTGFNLAYFDPGTAAVNVVVNHATNGNPPPPGGGAVGGGPGDEPQIPPPGLFDFYKIDELAGDISLRVENGFMSVKSFKSDGLINVSGGHLALWRSEGLDGKSGDEIAAISVSDGGLLTLLGNTQHNVIVGDGGTLHVYQDYNDGDVMGISQTWESGGTFKFSIENTNKAGIGWGDATLEMAQILLGESNITATTENPFTIEIASYLSLGLSTSEGSVLDWDPTKNFSTTLISAVEGISGFDLDAIRLITDSFEQYNPILGTGRFYITLENIGDIVVDPDWMDINRQSIVLHYEAVPEPETWALLTGCFGLLLASRRFRSRTRQEMVG